MKYISQHIPIEISGPHFVNNDVMLHEISTINEKRSQLLDCLHTCEIHIGVFPNCTVYCIGKGMTLVSHKHAGIDGKVDEERLIAIIVSY